MTRSYGQSGAGATATTALDSGPPRAEHPLNTIDRRYAAYYYEGAPTPAASPDAAIVAAAHTVLVGVVNGFGSPVQKGTATALVDQAYASSLTRVIDGPARNAGVAVGRAAGAAMLTLRRDDGATRGAPYTPGVGPGKWRPHPNPVPANPPIAHPGAARGYAASAMPGWGNVSPFTLLSASQFWPARPPSRARPTRATSTR